jgi:hypothetical protein
LLLQQQQVIFISCHGNDGGAIIVQSPADSMANANAGAGNQSNFII